MTTLTEFLLARIAEDERPCVCLERPGDACGGGWCRSDCHACSGGDAYTSDTFRLAECEAKRRIVELCAQYEGRPEDATDPSFNGGAAFVGTNVLRLLASVYADHPDYRPEWRP